MAAMLAQTLGDEDPGKKAMKIQLAEGMKLFRNVKEQRSGELHTRSDHKYVSQRLIRRAPRVPDPDGPNPSGPIGLEILFVEAPYPPCSRALVELKPVLLSELVLNSHHRERVLLVKLVKRQHASGSGL